MGSKGISESSRDFSGDASTGRTTSGEGGGILRIMAFRYDPSILPVIVSALFCLGNIAYGLAHRHVRGAMEFFACALIGTLWAGANALETAGVDLGTKVVWSNIQYISYAFGPIVWLALALSFSDSGVSLKASSLIVLSIIPLITSTAVWFDPFAGFVRHSISLKESGSFSFIEKAYSPWFWVHFIYGHLINAMALLSLFRTIRGKNRIFRSQALYVLSGFSLILISNFLFVTGFKPFGARDPTPMLFPITTILIWWATFRVRIFSVVPLARSIVVGGMANGLIVVDESGVIVDDNDAAAALFGYMGTATGQRLDIAIPPLAAAIGNDFRDSVSSGRPTYIRREMMLPPPGAERMLELFASPIADSGRKGIVWAIIATDIGEIRRAQAKIAIQKMNLAVAEERDRLSRDLHDNLGQVLSFAVIQSDVVLKKLDDDDVKQAAMHLRRLREIVGKAHDDLRGFVRGLRDLEYDELPFEDLIAREAELFAQYSGIKVANKVAQGDVPALDSSVKKQLAQIAKEALNNVAKHASATKVDIDLAPAARGYAFSIEDDGIGIGSPGERGGVGLRIIEERANSFGGRVEIASAKGRGTRISVFIPASEKGPRR